MKHKATEVHPLSDAVTAASTAHHLARAGHSTTLTAGEVKHVETFLDQRYRPDTRFAALHLVGALLVAFLVAYTVGTSDFWPGVSSATLGALVFVGVTGLCVAGAFFDRGQRVRAEKRERVVRLGHTATELVIEHRKAAASSSRKLTLPA